MSNISSDFPTRQPAPKIGENGNWWVWDAELEEYVNTGISAKGEKGDTGEKGDKGEKGDTGRSSGAVISQTLDSDGMYINNVQTTNQEWNGGSY